VAESTQQAGFEQLLAESRELVSAQLGAAMRVMLDKADEALSVLAGASRDRDAQAACQQTRKLLGSERHKLETEFQKAFLKEFRARSKTAAEAAGGFAEVDTPLSLVGNDDLEETLRFKDLASKLRRYCDEELLALDQRVGVLLGDANLAAEANPFSPQAICDAYQQACHQVAADARMRGVLRGLFDDHVMDAIRTIYKAVNALLVKNAILPKIKYQAAKSTQGKRAAIAEGAADKKVEENGDPAAAGESLFAMLQNLVATNAAAAGLALGAAPAPAPGQRTVQGAELLGSLTQIQKGDVSAIPGGLPAAAGPGTANLLRELKSSSFGAGMAAMDAMTLDIVAMLFDMLFDDPKIPIALKGLIGRLQIPMLKVAIADKAFFSKKSHPARVMLDAFGEVALRLPPEFGPHDVLFMQLEAIVHYVVDGFQDDVAIFTTVEQQLRGVIAEEEGRVATESRAVTEQAEQTEKLALAKSAAEDEVRPRVQAHKLPGPVLEFLVQHWLRFLLLVHAKSGPQSAEWKDALAAMDQLIWSLEARPTPEDRRKLAALVPGLLKRLSAGLQALGAADDVRSAFFGELMKLHTETLHAKPKAAGAVQAPVPVDFAAPVTVNNPYGGGAVQVTAASMTSDPPANLETGDWVEFRQKGGGNAGSDQKSAKKLLFHTPKRTSYIFSDRNGRNMMDLSRGELVRRLRAGEAVRLDEAPEEPLFDRIMNALLGKLKTARAPKAA
jgi:Protein of unknown function (DUF1631)